MPAYRVERSILIDADAESVFDTVADFSTWNIWSPWLVIAHEAVVTVTDDPKSVGSIYRWSGEFVGRGEIEHRQLDRPRKIVDTLRFEKPFKSTSQVEFSVQSEAGQTRLSWAMDGTLPWFLFWMRRNMETFIGMDYDRGLKMVREYIQTGRVLSKSTVEGIEKIPPRRVIGLRESCQLAEIGPVMEKTFARVGEEFSRRNLPLDGEMLSVYHPSDMMRGQFEFTCGFVVDSSVPLPAGLVECSIPAAKALHVKHVGSYENLGNAWSGAHQFANYRKRKLAKTETLEIYRNTPEDTADEDLVTDIYLPLR
ncbi:SRPBCC family protein [Rosistilla oblonga]|uniref:SRPBCC family protein n=1 Tax=Rosistilla oblonga TaxID=2527990 RepID=UPI003A96FD19